MLRKSDSGEHNLLLVYFLRENGLKYVLARRSSKLPGGAALPDLFETGQLIVEQKEEGKPAFLKEYSGSVAHKGIGRSYAHLQAASSLARFFEKNLLHMEHFPEAWDLLQDSLAALSEKPNPEALLLKTCFLFARSEGYPVAAHWLEGKNEGERHSIAAILKSPLDQIDTNPKEVNSWVNDLGRFFKRETDLLPITDVN
ncbi:hypothetical protein G0Q06_12400 [Puniceicoccales bacterium CK1056]|uniref:DNA repair protein RecO n=1 Tax=Oceanipulchritudo coccoides TaxID=2706888 RepID=A0A6B2M2S5_9BACT|nr:hypothetical protein [Oceanipulchritudo coccoides]NDV63258.1 hypothetical protein [Oceanipulchritudo coccoides]